MSPRKRHTGLAAILLVTLLAAYLAPQNGPDLAPSAPARPQRQSAAAVARPAVTALDAESEVLAILPRAEDDVPESVFVVPRPVQPAPAPAAAPALAVPPPAPAQAPPLPFQVFGRAIEDGKVTLFLRWGERNILARVGDTVEGQYRLESEDGRTLQVRYLPLDQPQSLTISVGK